MLTLLEAGGLAVGAQDTCADAGDTVSAGMFEDAIVRGAFSDRWTNEQRRAYAAMILGDERKDHMKLSIARPMAAMARVFLVWLLRNTEGPC